jgi:hypothetical protein
LDVPCLSQGQRASSSRDEEGATFFQGVFGCHVFVMELLD